MKYRLAPRAGRAFARPAFLSAAGSARARLAAAGATAACATVAFAAAAGGWGCRPEPAGTRAARQPARATSTDTTRITPVPDSLALELVVPPQVRSGEPIPITLRVENRSGRTLDLYLRGRTTTFDVVVARAGGEVVWRRLEDEIIPAIVHLRPLAPGGRLEASATWDQRTKEGQPLDPGEYVARGLLLVEDEPLPTPPATFRVVQ
jgi:hypothetical protein